MNNLFVGIISVLSYCSASALTLKALLNNSKQPRISMYMAWLGASLHTLYTILLFQQHHDFNFSFFNAAALVALFIVFILLFAALDKPVEKLGIAVFPLAAILLGFDMIFPEKNHPLVTHNWEMSTHIFTSIIAFSLLNIAALQAILLAVQEQQLRSHKPKRLMLALPPLQAMETLLFQMIASGLFFLTVSLLTGFVFIDDLFAQHLVHKTVLSIIAWFIFSALLIGRLRYGWRGNSAIKWTLIGFVLLLLAYFGSKLVLELILKKV
ncbi:cytochrome c biogenesis protein CcsA [Methylomonas sp. AM2-LC]|uniref:cytochrome C assembly family protein n=1 Tax=Methylomonas sp. AM2-LC TaxID=3153301 RepID=UPI00326705AD